MPLLKYTASADTTITDAKNPITRSRAYYSNMGAADSLEVFSIYTSGSQTEKSRILINFPIDSIINDRNSGVIPQAGDVNFIFKLYNVKHPETLPKNYDLSIKPVSGSWSEGYGLDLDNYTDVGEVLGGGTGVNWKFKSDPNNPQTVWSIEGGDYYSTYEKIVHIDTGLEDIELDITDIIEDQISGLLPKDGLGIALKQNFEDGTYKKSFYTKKFSARSSEYFYKTPSLEVRWETYVKDDRGEFYFNSDNLENEDNIQNIYFYNKVNGSLKNLPGGIIPKVKLYDENNELLIDEIQSNNINTGIYQANINITGSYEQVLKDVWYYNDKNYYTGSIEAKIRTFSDTFVENDYVFSITNLKNSYKLNEKPSIRIFGRDKNWTPNIYSVASNSIQTKTFKNLYYKIFRIVDNLTIIDYGIEPIAYTKCSYDKNGNYFDLDMSMLEPGYAYGIKLMLLNEDIRTEIPNIFRFKVD